MSKSKHDKELQEALEKAIKKADKAAAKAAKAAKKAKNTLTTSQPAKIIDVTDFYFSNSNEIATYVKPKKKALLEIINSKDRSTMKTFISKKKLNLKLKKDLITFFKYYDSLISTNTASTEP